LPLWRLNNLYWIKTKEGKRIKFELNWAQQLLYHNLHTCNIILKARQLGCTTFFCILLLDKVLWYNNTQAGIIAHTLDDATNIFKDKLKYAFDNLHPVLRAKFRCLGDSAKELSFTNGSSIRVGTSLRSSTLQYLHISEFGKVCAKNPEKAREIITGSLNTVQAGQNIYIESTAEGSEGRFFDMCNEARAKEPTSDLEFKFHFLPWWKEPLYTQGVPSDISNDLADYFAKLELDGIKLSLSQKWWYAAKIKSQREDMTREYPSTPDEAFQASQEGYWYSRDIKEAYDTGRITNIAYDKAIPVHTSFDLGQADAMSIWFFQINRTGEVNIIDFFQQTNFPLDQLMIMLDNKRYKYGTHIWPFDANARDKSGITFVDQARDHGLYGTVLKPHGFINGINQTRTAMSKFWFDKTKCKQGLQYLQSYKKQWSNTYGGWTSQAVHDDASHAADSLRYLAAGMGMVDNEFNSTDDNKAAKQFLGY
jgi:hypothetical protein